MPNTPEPCDCGKSKTTNAVQCTTCSRAAFRRLAKIAVALGAILGFVCSSLPQDYQAPCKVFASVLSTC
jgi:hypothetical protein